MRRIGASWICGATDWRTCRCWACTPTRALVPILPVHRHAGGWEICYLERGNQVFEVRDQTYRLRGGDVFLTFPDEPHSTGGSPSEPGVLYWLNVRRPAEGRTLLGWPRAESQMLLASLDELAPSPFSRDTAHQVAVQGTVPLA